MSSQRSTAQGGPNVVQDGLVLYLDAANHRSYVSGSTVWRDLTQNNYTGSLINGPMFSNANAGSIVFDGQNDRVIVPYNNLYNLQTSTTINVWMNANNGGKVLIYDKTSWIGWEITRGGVKYSGQVGSDDFSAGTNLPADRWGMITFIVDRESGNYSLYANGAFRTTSPITHPAINFTSTPLWIGARAVPDSFLSGSISQISFYNRVLTAQEVLQNYNALKARYNL